MIQERWAKPELPRHEQFRTSGMPDASGPSPRHSQQHEDEDVSSCAAWACVPVGSISIISCGIEYAFFEGFMVRSAVATFCRSNLRAPVFYRQSFDGVGMIVISGKEWRPFSGKKCRWREPFNMFSRFRCIWEAIRDSSRETYCEPMMVMWPLSSDVTGDMPPSRHYLCLDPHGTGSAFSTVRWFRNAGCCDAAAAAAARHCCYAKHGEGTHYYNNNLSIYLLLAIYYEAEHLYNNVDNDLVGSYVLLLLLLHSHSVLLKTTTIFIMKGIWDQISGSKYESSMSKTSSSHM